jgi:hypothetical protein
LFGRQLMGTRKIIVALVGLLTGPFLAGRWLAGAIAIFVAISGRSARAESLEYAVKAAFLFNFAKFIEWPRAVWPTDSAPLPICVLGFDPFGDDLDRVTEGRSVQGHPIEVRRLSLPSDSPPPGLGPAASCTILFVGKSDAGVRRLLRSLRDAPVLTVGDEDDFTTTGGCLRFFLVDKKVRFEINLAAVERAHLKVSSKLLILARVVGRP